MSNPKYNDETLARDIRDLAQEFLTDPETRSVIDRAGIPLDLESSEEKFLINFADMRPFMQRFHRKPNFSEFGLRSSVQAHKARNYNPYVALAVAFHVVAGDFASVDDKGARRLIEDNMVPGDEIWDHVRPGSEWKPRKLKFEEYYEVLSEAWKGSDFQRSLDRAVEALAKVHGDYLDRHVWGPARDQLDAIAFKIMLRRGWVSDPKFWSYAMIIKDHGACIDDVDEIKSIIKKFHGDDIIDFGGGE